MNLALNMRKIFMRKTLPLLAVLLSLGALVSGCANMENKFGRGLCNTLEIVRGGEMGRSIEQTGVFDNPDAGYTTGFIRGLDRTLARTGVGIYEIVTFPIPPYDPVFTDYLAPNPVYPDSYTPGLAEGSPYSTDAIIGFSGGDVAPLVPGSKFRVFNVH